MAGTVYFYKEVEFDNWLNTSHITLDTYLKLILLIL